MTYLFRYKSSISCLTYILFFISLSALIPVHVVNGNELSILYWNDRHANISSHSDVIDGDSVEVGSAATLTGMVKLLRAIDPEILTLIVGDELAGSAVAAKTKGLSEIRLLNEIGIDAFSPGPHCFDYGWKSLLTISKKADFPILLANAVYSIDRKVSPLLPSDTIFLRNGVRVAVAGLIDDKFNNTLNHELIAGLSVWDPASAAREFVSNRRENSDILIVLSCLGWKQDSLLATQVNGLDVIIGSSDLELFDPPREVNGVVITQAGGYGQWLGQLKFDIDTVNHKIVSFESHMLPVEKGAASADLKAVKLINKQKKELKKLHNPIGLLETEWEYVSDGQSNTAQWIADMVRYIEPRSWASVIDNRDIRKGLKAGQILESDMWEICPYDNTLIVFRVVGAELKRMVKHKLKNPQPYMTWSNINLKAEGGEIISLTINGEPIREDNFYLMTTTGSMWRKLEQWLGIDPATRPNFTLPGVTQRGKMIEAVTNLKTINSPLDDRWDVQP